MYRCMVSIGYHHDERVSLRCATVRSEHARRQECGTGIGASRVDSVLGRRVVEYYLPSTTTVCSAEVAGASQIIARRFLI